MRMCRIGEAHGADLAVAPGLFDDPRAGVETVRAFGKVLGEFPLRSVAAAAILVDHHIAGADEMRGGLASRHRLGHAGLDFGARPFAFPVRRPFHDDRKRRLDELTIDDRSIDIGRKANPVAHAHHHIAMDRDVIG